MRCFVTGFSGALDCRKGFEVAIPQRFASTAIAENVQFRFDSALRAAQGMHGDMSSDTHAGSTYRNEPRASGAGAVAALDE